MRTKSNGNRAKGRVGRCCAAARRHRLPTASRSPAACAAACKCGCPARSALAGPRQQGCVALLLHMKLAFLEGGDRIQAGPVGRQQAQPRRRLGPHLLRHGRGEGVSDSGCGVPAVKAFMQGAGTRSHSWGWLPAAHQALCTHTLRGQAPASMQAACQPACQPAPSSHQPTHDGGGAEQSGHAAHVLGVGHDVEWEAIHPGNGVAQLESIVDARVADGPENANVQPLRLGRVAHARGGERGERAPRAVAARRQP